MRKRLASPVMAAALLLWCTTLPLAAQTDAAARHVRILFIGNSYTYFNDMPRMLQSMAAADTAAVIVELGSSLIGGASLRQHWNRRTIDLIRRGEWDYVVLQDQSLVPLQSPEQLLTYGRRFGNEIRAAGAQPVLYVTWPRRNRPSAQDSINRAYLQLARAINAKVIPVGPAWREFQQRDSVSILYDADGSHPVPLGSLIAAGTFHRALFGRFPSNLGVAGVRVSPQLTGHVQHAVEAAVSRFSTLPVK